MKHLVILIIMILSLSSCKPKKPVDAIYYNAIIYTADNTMSRHDAMAIDSGRIVAIGMESNIRANYSTSNWCNLEGKFVYPGFNDPHCHFFGYGLGLQRADLVGSKSMDEIIKILQDHQKQYPSDWVLGRGWDQNNWTIKEFPDKSVLDKTFSDKPVCLERIDGHAVFLNSRALKIAGISAKSGVEGGAVLHNTKGEPSGVLIDNAMSLIYPYIPKESEEAQKLALLDAQQRCFGVGLTCISDAGLEDGQIEMIDNLQRSGKLKLRIYAMINPTENNFTRYLFKGPVNTGRLVVCSIKLFADGALGSRGALLLRPYSDDPSNSGLRMKPPEYYERICDLALKNGYQVNTHCIGDSANRMILKIYTKYLQGKNDKRWRIEHAQVVSPLDLHLFKDYSVIPSIQATHATSDMGWAGKRLGPERIKSAYAYQDLLKQNGWLPDGSDFPVENINPIYGFYAAVARKDLKGFPEGGFQKENALNREQALRAMTIWAAKACFMEKMTGSLEKGKFADFVVTDQDLMTIEESKIPGIKVLRTVIEGEEVYPGNQ